jgi:voltage-gated potassium channel Kch
MPGLLEALLGLVLLIVAVSDVFQSVVTPRPAAGRIRFSRYLMRALWWATRWVAMRGPMVRKRESLLGNFGPALVLVQLGSWLVLIILGYGLILDAIRTQIHPPVDNLGTAMYFAATSLLTIGFGDIVPMTALARAVVTAAGATGLSMFALVISFLFSLYAAFQRRETAVVALEAVASAPPSGVTLLESYGLAGVVGTLPAMFQRWQEWAAEVLDSHLAFPILAYFRSSHDNDSWIGSLGAVMDACTLMLSTVGDGEDGELRAARGWAKLSMRVGGHCIEDLVISFRLPDEHYVGVELSEYVDARARLAKAGYPLRPEAEGWQAFQRMRSEYAGRINALAQWWATPPAQWIGDRSPLRYRIPHPGRPERRRRWWG